MRLLSLVFVALLICTLASAESHPDFSGTWSLDMAASDSLDDIMKAQGQSWIARRAARGMAVTQTIVQHAHDIDIDGKSTFKNRHETIPIGGDWQARTTDEAGALQTRTDWNADALVTYTKLTLKDGTAAELDITRTLQDGGKTMLQIIELTPAKQATLRARRVFRLR